MNIKSSFFYAALAACLGTGYVGGTVVSQRDVDRLGMQVRMAQCDETEDDKRFNSTTTHNSPGKNY